MQLVQNAEHLVLMIESFVYTRYETTADRNAKFRTFVKNEFRNIPAQLFRPLQGFIEGLRIDQLDKIFIGIPDNAFAQADRSHRQGRIRHFAKDFVAKSMML